MTLQSLVDAHEDLNIRAYAVWSGWQREHALAELEREAVRQGRSHRFPSIPRLPWMALVGALAIGGLAALRYWQ